LMCSDDLKELILSLRPTRLRIEELLKSLADALKRSERRPCSLDEAVMQVCERIEKSLNGLNIEIEKPRPLGASIDVPFHAAIFALAVILDNARDALRDIGRDNGKITIKVDQAPDKVFCDITDNGPGVPPALREKLLRDVCPSEKTNSNGVGLYFSAFLLRVYGGDIILAPERPEPGARFRIQFPK
jgi:sensor histidine kinase regulating citrate/malate metabolism